MRKGGLSLRIDTERSPGSRESHRFLDRRRREAAFESFAGQPELNASSDTTLKYLLIP